MPNERTAESLTCHDPRTPRGNALHDRYMALTDRDLIRTEGLCSDAIEAVEELELQLHRQTAYAVQLELALRTLHANVGNYSMCKNDLADEGNTGGYWGPLWSAMQSTYDDQIELIEQIEKRERHEGRRES